MMTAAALGFLLGLRHAFDPDHVIAVSTIVARHRSPWSASWVGASWGVGHGLTILAIGALVIGLHIAVPDGLARSAEIGVGVLLVGLGVANLFAAYAPADAATAQRDAASPLLGRTLARSALVGLAHGLAGSAAVALLASAAMPSPTSALLFLGIFGAGSVTGMVAFSLLVGGPLSLLANAAGHRRFVLAGSGLLSLLFGAYLLCALELASATGTVS
jgi:high-affinity nickel-transport protein